MQVIQTIQAGSAAITLHNACISPTLIVDELVLEAGDLVLTPGSDGRELQFSSGETRFRGMLTEASVNTLNYGAMPADSPVRNVRVTLYSGRAQVKGHFVKSVMSLPFTLDARPVLTNGIRLTLDCGSTQIGGIGIPAAVVDIIQRVLNEKLSLDLTKSTFPVRLDEVKCEPGRLTVLGRARLSWPPDVSVAGANSYPEIGEPVESK